jgi:sialate O-acetylesterase
VGRPLVAGLALLAALLTASVASAASAALQFNGVFGDHAVLQRGKPLPVWGWAPPGAEVTVSLAGQTARAVAGNSGRWRVTFAPLAAGGPHELKATMATGAAIVCRDVLIGEVWLFSGQSNMGGPLATCVGGPEAFAAVDLPQVRIGLQYGAKAENQTERRLGASTWVSAARGAPIEKWIGIHFAFGAELHRRLQVPIGLVAANRGGTRISTWTSLGAHRAEPAFAPSLAAFEAAQAQPPPAKLPAVRNEPAFLYDELIAPLAPFALRGVLWYQGESDSPYAELYRRRFPVLIRDWRTLWGEPALPFLFAQIAYSEGKPHAGPPVESRQAELREAQALALAVEHTAMIVTYDLVRPTDDVHFRDKLPVGHRFALAALATVYGEAVEYRGPVFQRVQPEGRHLRVHFTHATGLHAKSGTLGGFMIAADDRQWRWAEATIEGETVVLRHPEIAAPVAARYNWVATPCGANLANAAGLPAAGFRSDRWPVSTEGRSEVNPTGGQSVTR